MKRKLLAVSLVFLSGVAGAFAAQVDGDFHDPFAADSAEGKPTIKVSDPLEKLNRATYKFNDKFYEWLLKPAAKGYRFVVPTPVRESLDRCFSNIKYPVRLVNNLLQGKVTGAAIESGRFICNSTIGLGGFFDPAACKFKLKAQPADFDQTLGFYGIPAGFYLTLPLLGPSSARGAFGFAGDGALNPTLYLNIAVVQYVQYGVSGGEVLNKTSLRLEEYDTLKNGTFDPYIAMRSAYFEHRVEMVKAAHDVVK